MSTDRRPDWAATASWRELLRAAADPAERARIVRMRAEAAGCHPDQDGVLCIPAGLDPAAAVSLHSQCILNGVAASLPQGYRR